MSSHFNFKLKRCSGMKQVSLFLLACATTKQQTTNHLNTNMEINSTRSSLFGALYSMGSIVGFYGLKGDAGWLAGWCVCVLLFLSFDSLYYRLAYDTYRAHIFCNIISLIWLLLIDFCGTQPATKHMILNYKTKQSVKKRTKQSSKLRMARIDRSGFDSQ